MDLLDYSSAVIGYSPTAAVKLLYGAYGLDGLTGSMGLPRLSDRRSGWPSPAWLVLVAEVTVALDIAAHSPDGTPEHTVCTVNENSRTLKFDSDRFEVE